jgi:hypothetical protein
VVVCALTRHFLISPRFLCAICEYGRAECAQPGIGVFGVGSVLDANFGSLMHILDRLVLREPKERRLGVWLRSRCGCMWRWDRVNQGEKGRGAVAF